MRQIDLLKHRLALGEAGNTRNKHQEDQTRHEQFSRMKRANQRGQHSKSDRNLPYETLEESPACRAHSQFNTAAATTAPRMTDLLKSTWETNTSVISTPSTAHSGPAGS